MPATDTNTPSETQPVNTAILRLTVNNHPGVMLQICGLFVRRNFNLEGIFCSAVDQGATQGKRMKSLAGKYTAKKPIVAGCSELFLLDTHFGFLSL